MFIWSISVCYLQDPLNWILKIITKGNSKFVPLEQTALVVVMDLHNDYPLGYAIGDQVTDELMKKAYASALQHVYELTGAWHCPYEIYPDRLMTAGLKQFLRGIAPLEIAEFVDRRPAMYLSNQFKSWSKLIPNPFVEGSDLISLFQKPAAVKARKKETHVVSKDQLDMWGRQFIENIRENAIKGASLPRQKQWLLAFNKDERCSLNKIQAPPPGLIV